MNDQPTPDKVTPIRPQPPQSPSSKPGDMTSAHPQRTKARKRKKTGGLPARPVPRLAMSADDLAGVLDERGASYGAYIENSVMAQEIKDAVRRGGFFSVMAMDERQSLDEIATKIARAVTGKFNIDNWRDIEGYARLVRERAEKELKKK